MRIKSLKAELQSEIVEKTDMYRECSDDELTELIDETINKRGHYQYIPLTEKRRLRREIFNSLRRLDILQELLEDESITEIMVNGPESIFIERDGGLLKWDRCFEPPEKLDDIVQQIAAMSNRVVNEASPIADARLPDGSRVNIVLPPVSLCGPVVTIRKFSSDIITVEKLKSLNSLTEETAEFLKNLVISGYNIFVSGGTGSGKTTFLNVLSEFVPEDERIITIEDSAELQLKNVQNLVRLEVRAANVEGNNGITIRDLIKSALRMRPSRIIVGEVRDAASVDMLQALNTGHSGMSTGHANSPRDMLSRLETMVLLGADIPLMAVRRQIASAIDIIVHLGRLRDKSRRVLEICEVAGFADGEIELNRLYEFRERGEENGQIIGGLESCKNSLKKTAKLAGAGIDCAAGGGNLIENG